MFDCCRDWSDGQAAVLLSVLLVAQVLPAWRMRTDPMITGAPTHGSPFRGGRADNRFRHCVGLCLLALVALYAVYAVGAFAAFGPATPFGDRLLTVLGMAVFPLPFLAAPAAYFAALGRFDLYGEMGASVCRGDWRQLGFVALGTCVVLFIAPVGYEYAVRGVTGPNDAVLLEGMAAENNARFMVPFAVGLFVIVAGIGGAVTGRITRGLTVGARYAARWTVGAALVGSFLASRWSSWPNSSRCAACSRHRGLPWLRRRSRSRLCASWPDVIARTSSSPWLNGSASAGAVNRTPPRSAPLSTD